MKPFDLEEYLKNPERKVVTRNGRAVKIHCTNYYSAMFPIVAEIEGEDGSRSFAKNGRYACDEQESPHDLFFATGKREGWVNIYRNKTNGESYCGKIYASEEEARTQTDILTTIKIEWEE